MNYEEKAKEELIDDLIDLRKQLAKQKKFKTNNSKTKVKESRLNYSEIFDVVNDAIIIHELRTGNILDVNKKMCEMYGYTKEEARHLSVEDLSAGSPYDQNDGLLLLGKAAKGEPQLFEWLAKHKSGRQFWVEVNLKCIVLGDKKVLLAMSRDITKRKQSEELIKNERKRLFSLLDRLPAYVCLIAPDYSIYNANQYFRNRFGNPEGKTCYEIYRNQKFPCEGCPTFSVFDTNVPKEWEWTSLDGDIYNVYDYPFTDIDGSSLVLELGIDITERKRVEEVLRTTQAQLQGIIEFLPDAIVVVDMERKVIAWNRAMEEITGVFSEDIIGKGDYIYYKALDGKAKPMLMNLIFEDNKEIERQFSYFKRKDNKLFGEIFISSAYGGKGAYLWGVASPLYDCDGNLIGAIETIRNITELKHTLEKLRLSEERFFKAFHNNPTPMAIVRMSDDKHIEINKSYERTYGYIREDTIGRTVLDLGLFYDTEEFAHIKQQLKEQGYVHNREILFITYSGDIRNGLVSYEVIELNNEACRLVSLNDITEYKKMEKEMARLERLNLVGEMAAGIGHEIRNPITTVRGFLQMYRKKDSFIQYKDNFDLMIEELDRANSIITEYLSLARNKPVDLKPYNINKIVQTLFPLIQADAMNADKCIELELEDIPDLLLNEKEIRQMILNFVRNGLEAMTTGGKIAIKTFMENEAVVLTVQDEGKGISEEILDKIGTPFLTTKENGTGLGLAICYGIANRHNAKIDIETSSRGTTFFVRLKQDK